MAAAEVAAAEEIEVVEQVMQLVDQQAIATAGLEWPGLSVAAFEVGWEAAEETRHGDFGLAVTVVGRGIDEHGAASVIDEIVAAPQVTV